MSEIKDTVSFSSLTMAAVRALETQRADRLFEDPLAALLAGDEVIAQTIPSYKEYDEKGRPVVVVRTRFFDDFLKSTLPQMHQVVILGAGMDTRAFRICWSANTSLYEIDRPEVMQYKESVLKNKQAQCNRYLIPVDIRQNWSELLIAQGYQIEIPSIWLLEGLLYYLSEVEVHELLKTITNLSAPGSRFGADLINTQLILQSSGSLAQHWHYGCDEPEKLLEAYGWSPKVVHPSDEGVNYGRFTYKFPPREVSDTIRYFFVTATKN